ncbi:DUF354 domain-containing protein [Spirosoma validum]|uniref:DUF354 domain-containing protein n=1 Tax=Spirosoma validum TaxID=2771355 RepID=A0A927GCE7_9BACT|nr:DUF354 domain-containing protein [Spirosoma validum]MBD2752589.1 DUF354 domain-containing protein [Spirosoma validum]
MKKKILVDINHPAHVHLFRHFIGEMKAAGYEVFVTAKNVESIVSLLTRYGIPFILTGRKKDGLFWKYIVEFFHVLNVLWLVVTKRIEYGIGVSMVLPVVSTVTGMKSFCLDDDDVAVTPVFGKFVSWADVNLTPSALAYENRGPNHVCHASFHELAYLHPNRFTPDPAILDEVGVVPHEPFFVLRFNAFKAHHDEGAQGLSMEQKRALVALLEPHGKLFITTERSIDPELKKYQVPVSPEKIHSLMYYASLFIGDSQTMTSEAALLGTPAIKLNSFAGRLSIPNELEQRYELCYSFLPGDFDKMLLQINKLLETPDLKAEWNRRKERMLADKIDLTTFLVGFVTNYPESFSQVNQKVVHDSLS